MKRLTGKTMFLWVMTLILCVTACAPAFASVGDRTLLHETADNGSYGGANIMGVYRLKDSFCVITREWETTVLKYATPQSEPEKFETKSDFGGMDAIDGEQGEAEFPAEAEAGAEVTAEAAAPAEENPEEAGAPIAAEENPEDDFFADMEWDSPEEGEIYYEDTSDRPDDWFTWNGELYGIVYRREMDEEEYKIAGGAIKHAKLENGEIILEDSDLPALDLDPLLEAGDFYGLNSTMACGNYLVGMYYGNEGSNLVLFDLTTGMYKELPAEGNYETITAGPDGCLLVLKRVQLEDNSWGYALVRFDPESMEEEPFTELNGLRGYRAQICYDQEKDALYYVDQGEIWVKPLNGEAAAVNECPVTDPSGVLLYDGFMIVWDYSTVLARNTDPSKRSGTTLRVSSMGYGGNLSNAVLEMSNTRGDLSVVLDEGGMGWLDSGILQDMMNQDGHTDIYILPFEGKDFRALRERGYLAEISGNQQIDEYVERMYPYIRDVLKKDGKLIALPMYVTGEGIGINMRTWKKLGGTEEDLPKTWNQFFDWMEKDVPERVAGTEARVTMYDKNTLYTEIKRTLVTQYQIWLDSKGGEQVFNSPVLKDPLKRVDNLDWAALKIPEEEMNSFMWSSDNPPLLETNQSPCFSDWGGGSKLMMLSFEEGEDPVIPVELYVAVINPFSSHQEEAKEFLALAMKNLSTSAQYSFFADKTEPIEQEGNKDWYNGVVETIETLKEQLETAEGEEKSSLEEQLQFYNDELAYAEEYRWVISPDEIKDYQERLPYLKVLDYFFLYDIFNTSDSEELGQTYENLFGEGDPEEVLTMIDNKIQTIRKEGN